jgi:anthranilate phosphoribosyltransferase
MNANASDGGNLAALIAQIATGPKLSKDLSREQARAGMSAVLHVSAHPVQAAIFLIALRMKRESDDENLGLLDALLACTERVTVDVPELLDVSDPYDGFTRALPASVFLPAVLAACGVAAISHGVDRMGPKFGLGHARVLHAAGVDVSLSPAQAAARVADPRAGWAYLDQSRYSAALYGLAGLRKLMVKRTALATLERVLGPLRARGRTHLLVGYVHTAYPRIYALLARESGFASALIVRGGEGGVVPSLRQPGQAWALREQPSQAPDGAGVAAAQPDLEHLLFAPGDAGIAQQQRAAPMPDAAGDGGEAAGEAHARACAEAGLAALSGQPGAVRDSLVYAGALCLRHLRRHADLARGAAQLRTCLDDGSALRHLCA